MAEFIAEFNEFATIFDDQITTDAYAVDKLEELVQNFLTKYHDVINGIEFAGAPGSKFPAISSAEMIEEDTRLLNQEICQEIPIEANICANFYSRASRSCYLSQTLSELNGKKVQDRTKPFEYGRLALRYDPTILSSCKQYTMALGWYLDKMRGGIEKARMGRLFYNGLKRCLQIDPKDSLTKHVMARYYFSVAQLSWLEKTLASTLFEAHELSFTFKDTENLLLEAHELNPNIAGTGLWLAKTSLAQKKSRDELSKWVALGLAAKSREPINDIERKELIELQRKEKLT